MSNNIISIFRAQHQPDCHEQATSPLVAIFLSIQEYVKSVLPEVQWCDIDMAQERSELRASLAFPALLIEMPEAQFSDTGSAGLFTTITIRMRLIEAPVSKSYADAPLDIRADALAFMELEHHIINTLHNWSPNHDMIQPLTIRSAATTSADPALRIRSLTFTTALEITNK